MAKIKIQIRATQRYWCPVMITIGWFAIELGACPDKIAAWVVKYGMKLEVI